MHKFGVSLRLGMMVSRIYRVKQSIWKCFRSMQPYLESLGLCFENWIWKVKRKRQ